MTMEKAQMHILELRADDVHAVLNRLLDRIRVSGLMLMAVEATRAEEGYVVTVCVGAEDPIGVEQLSKAISKMLGAALVRVGHSRALLPAAQLAGRVQ